jgi:sugar phosphate isomerase/epimerase
MIALGCKIDEVRVDGDLEVLIRDLRTFEALGVEAVEIPPHGLDLIANGRLRDPLAKEVRNILADFPFRYSVHAPNPINLMDQEEKALHVSALKATLDFASMIGAEVVVYHGGRFVPEECFPVLPYLDEPKWEQKTKMWQQEVDEVSELADSYPKLVIGIENARPYLNYSPYSYAERPDFLKNMLLAIGRANVGVTLDTGHMWMASKYHRFNFLAGIDQLLPWVRHLHVHDNFGKAVYPHEKQQTHQIPLGKGDSHMPIGWGEIPFDEVMAKVLRNFEGLIILELRSRYFRFMREALAALRDVVESVTNCKREERKRCEFAPNLDVKNALGQELRII